MPHSPHACLVGGGAWSGLEFISFPFPEVVLQEATHINALELLVVMVAVKIWHRNMSNSRVQIFCDNLASVQCLNSGRTKDPYMLSLLREICYTCARVNCQLKAIHLPGVSNRLADQLSRAPIDHSIVVQDLVPSNWRRLPVPTSLFQVTNPW